MSYLCMIGILLYGASTSKQGKSPLPGKRPCTAAFQGVNVAASIQFIFRVSTHVGYNRDLHLSTMVLSSLKMAYLMDEITILLLYWASNM